MRKKPLSLITGNRKPAILRGKILATHASDVVGLNGIMPRMRLWHAAMDGLPPEAKPWCYDIAETQQWLGYVPRYSLRQALEELVRYGPAGPPGPAGHGAPLQG